MRTILCHLQRSLYKLFEAKVIERSLSESFGALYCGVRSVESVKLSNILVSLQPDISNKSHLNQSYNLLNFSVAYPEMAKCDLNLQHLEKGVFGEQNNDNLEECTSINEESSKSDVDSFGLNMLFDMNKVVEKVKVELKEKRKKRKMQQKVCHSNKQKNKGKKWKERNNSEQSSFKDDKSDSDSSFGLTTLFDQKKTAHIKRKTKKAKKTGKRVAEDDSYGLEMLFSEKNISEKKSKRKRRESRMVNYDVSETVLEEDKGQEVIKPKKKRPNHFVAIRVSDSKIHLAIKDFQEAVLKENAKLKPTLIPLTSLHITMAVMHLDETQVNVAQDALEKSKDKIIEALEPVNFQLTFSGVGHFNNEVVFAKIGENKQGECLKAVNHVITTAFEKDGICLSNKKEWKPHLTLLKLSRKRSLRKSGIKKVEEVVYASWIESYFGEELVQNVHLCSMLGSKEDDGFYKCLSTITFPNDSDTCEVAHEAHNDETMLLNDED